MKTETSTAVGCSAWLADGLCNIRSAFRKKSKAAGMISETSGCLTNKITLHERVKMMLNQRLLDAKLRGNLLNRKVASNLKEQLEYLDSLLCQPVATWLKVLHLCFQIGVLSAKARVILLQQRHLIREQRKLRLQQINHVLAERGSGRNSCGVFGEVVYTHSVKSANSQAEPPRKEKL